MHPGLKELKGNQTPRPGSGPKSLMRAREMPRLGSPGLAGQSGLLKLGPPVERIESGYRFLFLWSILVGEPNFPTKKETVKGHCWEIRNSRDQANLGQA